MELLRLFSKTKLHLPIASILTVTGAVGQRYFDFDSAGRGFESHHPQGCSSAGRAACRWPSVALFLSNYLKVPLARKPGVFQEKSYIEF
jgi:hypothetical protein